MMNMIESFSGNAIIELLIRSTLILALGWFAILMAYRATAAVRHAACFAVLVTALALPCAMTWGPSLRVLPRSWNWLPAGTAVATGQPSSGPSRSLAGVERIASEVPQMEGHSPGLRTLEREEPVRSEATSAGRSSRIRLVVAGVWILGVSLASVPTVFGVVSLARLRRHARPLPNALNEQLQRMASQWVGRPVQGLVSQERVLPMTWGWRRPCLLFPADCFSWSSDQWQMVCRHELSHVRRWDYVTQLLGQLARALYWFHPLAWLTLSRLRREQELACDEAVIRSGIPAEDYAAELVAISSGRRNFRWDHALALAMGRAQRLETRLAMILRSSPHSTSPLRVWACALGMAVVGLVIGLAHPQIGTAQAPEETNQVAPSTVAEKPKNADQQKAIRDAYAVAELMRKMTEAKSESLNMDALKDMVSALEDPYARVIEGGELLRHVEGKTVGIGTALKRVGDQVVVVQAFENSPAHRGGIRPGDTLLQVNDEEVRDLNEVVKQLRGSAGTEVTLQVKAPGEAVRTITLIREEIRLPTLTGWNPQGSGNDRYWLDRTSGIAYLRPLQIDRNLVEETKIVLNALKSQGLKGIVLDLRENPGGLLEQTVDFAGLFLQKQPVVHVYQAPEFAEETLATGPDGLAVDIPLVVVIDPSTMSAAEIVAGSLADHGRAILVGERTLGKGSFQAIHATPVEGMLIAVSQGYFTTPNGRGIAQRMDSNEWGIDPSDGYYVPLTNDERQRRIESRDELAKAKELRDAWTAESLLRDAQDPQLAAAFRTLHAKLETGEFVRTGSALSEMEGEVKRRAAEFKRQLLEAKS